MDSAESLNRYRIDLFEESLDQGDSPRVRFWISSSESTGAVFQLIGGDSRQSQVFTRISDRLEAYCRHREVQEDRTFPLFYDPTQTISGNFVQNLIRMSHEELNTHNQAVPIHQRIFGSVVSFHIFKGLVSVAQVGNLEVLDHRSGQSYKKGTDFTDLGHRVMGLDQVLLPIEAIGLGSEPPRQMGEEFRLVQSGDSISVLHCRNGVPNKLDFESYLEKPFLSITYI